jgi:hypothetical protein
LLTMLWGWSVGGVGVPTLCQALLLHAMHT